MSIDRNTPIEKLLDSVSDMTHESSGDTELLNQLDRERLESWREIERRQSLLDQAKTDLSQVAVVLYSIIGYAEAYCRGIQPYVDERARHRHILVMKAARDMLNKLIPGLNYTGKDELPNVPPAAQP